MTILVTEKGFAIIGATSPRSNTSSIAYAASAPGTIRGYRCSKITFYTILYKDRTFCKIIPIGKVTSRDCWNIFTPNTLTSTGWNV